MKTKLQRIVSASIILTLLGGCAAPDSKENTGAALGAIVGGLLGTQMGKGNGRTAAILLGALAGGMLGSKYGRYLDEQDRKNVAAATERSLAMNATQQYVSPKSGAKVTMTPATTSSYEPSLQIPASPDVNTTLPLRIDRRTVFAKSDIDLLSSPNPNSDATVLFQRGESAEVVAYLPDSEYRLISRNGLAIGYAKEQDLAGLKKDVLQSDATAVKISTKKTAIKPTVKPAPATPQIMKAASATPAPAAKAPQLSTATAKTAAIEPKMVALSTECKVVTRTIQLPNGVADTEKVKFCKEPPTAWKQVA